MSTLGAVNWNTINVTARFIFGVLDMIKIEMSEAFTQRPRIAMSEINPKDRTDRYSFHL